MSVSLICILMRETAPQLAEYAQWAEELGVDRLLFQPLARPGPGGSPGRLASRKQPVRPRPGATSTLHRRVASMGRRSAHMDCRYARCARCGSTSSVRNRFKSTGAAACWTVGPADRSLGILYMCDVGHTAFGHVDDGAFGKPGEANALALYVVRSGSAGALRLALQSLPRAMGEGVNVSTLRTGGQTVRKVARDHPTTSARIACAGTSNPVHPIEKQPTQNSRICECLASWE